MQDWVVWQLIDSAFPSGGFVHSILVSACAAGTEMENRAAIVVHVLTGGVEAASQLGFIKDKIALDKFLQSYLSQTVNTSMKLMFSVYSKIDKKIPLSENMSAFAEVDIATQAVTCNHVANRASRYGPQHLFNATLQKIILPITKVTIRAQGQALLSSAASAFPNAGLMVYKRKIFSLYGHYPPVFGLVCKLLDINIDIVKRMFLFVTLRGLLSSAVRLNLVGPLEAQGVHYKYSSLIENLLKEDTAPPNTSDIYQTAPLLDIIHGAHDRLYSRLFNT